MSRTDYYGEQRVCSDCIMLIANGETPVELDEAATAAWLAEIEANTPRGFHWAPGNCGDNGEYHDDFSSQACACCRSTLGGSRCVAHLLEMGPLRRTIAYGDRVTVRDSRGEWTGILVQRRVATIAGERHTLYTVADEQTRHVRTGEYVRGSMASWPERAANLAHVHRDALVTASAVLNPGRRWTKKPKATAVVEAWQ